MTSVILRHCPDLAALLPRGTSAFARPVRVRAVPGGQQPGGRGRRMTSRHEPAARRADALTDARCSPRSGGAAPTGSARALGGRRAR